MQSEQNVLDAIPRDERNFDQSINQSISQDDNQLLEKNFSADSIQDQLFDLKNQGGGGSEAQSLEAEEFEDNGAVENKESRASQERDEAFSRDALIQSFQQGVAEFRAKKPDFTDAFNFLSEKRDQQLQAYGAVDPNFADAGKRVKQMQNDVYQLIEAARQAKKNPAELIYQIAETYGYGKRDFYRQLSDVQNASRSLTATPGYRAGQPINIDSLAEMPQADFDQWYWKNKDEFRRIMGG